MHLFTHPFSMFRYFSYDAFKGLIQGGSWEDQKGPTISRSSLLLSLPTYLILLMWHQAMKYKFLSFLDRSFYHCMQTHSSVPSFWMIGPPQMARSHKGIVVFVSIIVKDMSEREKSSGPVHGVNFIRIITRIQLTAGFEVRSTILNPQI